MLTGRRSNVIPIPSAGLDMARAWSAGIMSHAVWKLISGLLGGAYGQKAVISRAGNIIAGGYSIRAGR
jgi:hypothetical protein